MIKGSIKDEDITFVKIYVPKTRDGKSEHRHSRNQQTKMDWNG